MNIWLTSDLHLGHDRDFIWQARGYNSVEDMNKDLIWKYNSLVADDDEIYILGDCQVGKANNYGIDWLKQLKGRKFLAIGNHDSEARISAWEDAEIFENIQFGFRGKYKKFSFYLSHYPTLCANPGDKIYNLCGHSHTKDRWQDWDKGCYHCEVDAHNGYPVNLDDIIKEIKERRNNE